SFDILPKFLVADRDQLGALSLGEFVQTCGERVGLSLPCYDAPIRKHTSGHPLSNLFVVFELRLVFSEQASGDITPRGRTAALEESADHQRLVDVRHPHLAQEKFL